MGLLSSFIPVLAARQMNRKHNHIKRSMFEVVQTRNTILCGGNDVIRNRNGEQVLSIAGELKMETFYHAAETAEHENRNAICFFDPNYLVTINLSELNLVQEPVIFGVNTIYSPLSVLDARISDADISSFFERIVRDYFQTNQNDYYAVMGAINMIVNILSESGQEYITIENISSITMDLLTYDEREFINRVERKTGRGFSDRWFHYLTLDWKDIQIKFGVFWSAFEQSLGKYSNPNAQIRESLYSIFTRPNSGNICYCAISSSDSLLKSIVMSEMEMIYGYIDYFQIIDYHVALPFRENNYFLSTIDMCLIGNSLRELGIENMIYNAPTFICLGVNGMDARNILESLVTTGNWIRVTGGFGYMPHRMATGITMAERTAITENDLSIMRIRDGSALCIDANGYTFIDGLFI